MRKAFRKWCHFELILSKYIFWLKTICIFVLLESFSGLFIVFVYILFNFPPTNIPEIVIENVVTNAAILSFTTSVLKKQPSKGVFIKRCFENMEQIYRRTPMPKGDFNKFAKQLY